MAPAGLLSPLPMPQHVWQDIAMDFIVGLLKSEGKMVVLAVVDRLSKLPHFIPMVYPFSAVQVARHFSENIYKLYGLPRLRRLIVCDMDPIIVSMFWQELFG